MVICLQIRHCKSIIQCKMKFKMHQLTVKYFRLLPSITSLTLFCFIHSSKNFRAGVLLLSPVLTAIGIVVAAVLMLIMAILNAMGAKFLGRSTSVIAVVKLIVPILTMIVLFCLDFHSSNFHAAGGFMPYGWHGVVTALPLGGVIFSFIGSNVFVTFWIWISF